MVKIKKIFPFFILVLLTLAFFWKVFLKSYIPIPTDMLIGSYYPWLDSGSLPVKNPLITDVFSQFFLWKKIIADSYKNLFLPFWNPYSYSGYPLLATFHSAVFNPFNFLMVFFNQSFGWSLLVISQHLFSSITFYFLSKKITKNKFASITGSLVYVFNSFILSWSQFVTIGFIFIWLPLLFLNLIYFYETKKIKYLYANSIFLFLINISGHFQAMVISYFVYIFYFIYQSFQARFNFKLNANFCFSLILSVFLSSIQIFPTLELTHLSIRLADNSLEKINYGLIPIKNLITLYAPDYFGNPTTGNFWGSINYHETIAYTGFFSLIVLFISIKKLSKTNYFFVVLALLSLCLSFDTVLGKLIYFFKIPYLSSSGASRFIFSYTFSVSILTSLVLSKIKFINIKNILLATIPFMLFFITAFIGKSFFSSNTDQHHIAQRNLILPCLLLLSFLLISFIKNKIIKQLLILLLIIIDLFRAGWKNTPFTPKDYLFPTNPIINYLTADTDIFRVDKEHGPLLPSNTWTYYQLQSASGYDPIAPLNYSLNYLRNLNNNPNPTSSSRYLELNSFNPQKLAEYNIKYILSLKRDKDDVVSPQGQISHVFRNNPNLKPVFQYKSTVVLENMLNLPRVSIIGENGQIKNTSEIISYQPNLIEINFSDASPGDHLLLRDSYYPGWQAFVNGTLAEIKDNNSFRLINLNNDDKGQVIFKFAPSHFNIYLLLFFVSLLIITSILVFV